MIELKDITKTFQKDFYSPKFQALNNVSFKIPEGSLVGFLGANGAGKTTSLKIILNFIKPDQGEIVFGSELGGNFKNFLKNLGYLPERPYFHAALTGREFVRYMGQLHDVSISKINSQTKYWAERLEITHALDRKLFNYSKGMLQRIGFVACLVHDPKLLILDEPVSGLDPIGRKDIKDLMRELHRKGKTIFFSSHIVSDVEEICQGLVVLEKGCLVYEGSVYEMLERGKKDLCELVISTSRPDEYAELGMISTIDSKRSKLTIARLNKNKVISKVMNRGDEILSLQDERPSLEEIVYSPVTNKI